MVNKKLSIAIGADHRGYDLKEFIKDKLILKPSVKWIDVGAFDDERSDYPQFGAAVAQKIQAKQADLGILICGTGIGMAIVANRFSGIYAGLVWNTEVATLSREDDNTNVLVLPSDFVTHDQALHMIQDWLKAEFNRGRYAERLAMIDMIG